MALKFEITGDNSNLLHSLDGARDGVRRTAREIEESGLSVEDMFKRIGAAAGIAFSIEGIKSFISKVFEVRSYFQDIESSMEVFLGNQEKATQFTQELKDYAYYNMFEFSDLANASKQMIAYGHAVDTIIPRLDQLSNIATGTNADLMELVNLYNRAKNLGEVGSQSLASWATKGLVVKDVLKEMGEECVGTTVTFEQLNKVLDHVTGEGGMFHDLMLNQMNNLSAEYGQLQDELASMFNEIGEEWQDVLKDGVDVAIKLVENYKSIAKILTTLVAAYGAYKTAIMLCYAWEKAQMTLGTAKAFFELAKSVRSAKDAMLLFNMATSASPIGLIASVVAAAAVSFGVFGSSAEKSSEAVNKYGESAVKTMEKVNRLSTTLKGLTKGTKVYEQVLGELNQVLDEYGIAQIQEGDNIDTINERREKTIELIQQEAIERQRLNNLEQGQSTYEERVKNARDQLLEDMKGVGTWDDLGFDTWANDELRDNAEAITTIIAQLVEENIDLIAQKEGEEYQQGITKIYDLINERMRQIGISEGTINKQWVENALFSGHDNIVQKFIGKLVYAKNEYIRFSTAINAVAQSDVEAIEKPAEKAREAADFSKMETDELISKIVSLKKSCDELDREIDIKIKIGANINFNDDDLSDKEDLAKALGEMDSKIREASNDVAVDNLLKELNAAKSNFEYGSDERELADKYIAELKAKKKKYNPKDNSENLAREAAARRRKNAELDRKEAEERLRQYQSAQDAIIRAKIAGERNEGIRERMEREEQHRLNLQQIDDQEREYRKNNLDALKARWEAINKKKDAVYEDTQEYKDYVSGKRDIPLTDGQSKELDARRSEEAVRYLEENYKALDSMTNGFMTQQQERMKQTKEYEDSIASIESAITAEKEKGANADLKAVGMLQARLDVAKALLEVSKADAQELEFLMQYGDSVTKITAIQQSYGNQIKEASARGDAFGVMNLQKQMEEAISQVNFEELKKEVNWEAIFGNLGNVTKRELEAFKKKLQDFMESPEFAKADENVRRSALEGIANVNQALIGKGGVFSSIGTARNARNKAIEDLNTAQMNEDASRATLELLRQGLKDGWATKEDVSRQSADLAKKEAVTQDKKKQRANADTTYKDTRDDAVNKLSSAFNALRGAIAPVEDLFNSLGDSTVTEVFDTVGNALQSATGTFDSFNQLSGMFGKDSAIGSALGKAGPYAAAAAAAVNVATSLMPQGNMEEMNQHLEELNIRGGILASVMQDLEKTIAEGNTREAVKARDEAEAVYLSQLALEQEKISTEMHKWERGSHSVSAMLTDDSRFKELLSQVNDFMAANGRESRANSDWELTRMAPEDLAYLRKNNTDLYTELMLRIQGAENAHTGSGIADMFGDYIDNFAGKLKELDETLAENLTGISFDSVEDSFMGFLDNITGATDDGAQYIEKTLRNALIKSLVGNEYRKRLEEWYKKVAEAQERGTLAQETRALKDEYMAILKDAEKVQESIDKTIGYQPDAQSQSGINKSVSSMSQEVGNELNGRFTAIQISNESINRQMAAAVLQLSSMTGLLTGSQGGVLTDIREQMVTGNGFLADIVAWNKKMYDDFTSRMDTIATNTSRL